MKIYSVMLVPLIIILCLSPNTFSQKCKGKFSEIGPYKGGGGSGPKIISKPQPEYTEEARRHQITGTVVLRALFHSSGKVQDVCWVSSLPYGLTENAIKAAYKIVFEPVKKDGQPTSVTMAVMYNFDLY